MARPQGALGSAPRPGWSEIAVSPFDPLSLGLVLQLLKGPVEEAGGLIKVGLYNPEVGVADTPGKALQFVRTYEETSWLAALHPFDPGLLPAVRALADSMNAAGFRARYLEGQPLDRPRLHMKAHYMASRAGWDNLVTKPEFSEFFLAYLRERAAQVAERGQDRDLTRMTANLIPYLERLYTACELSVPLGERAKALWYLTVGSQNQNYRSMALDGEVLVIVAGLDAQVALADFVLLAGLTTWIDTPEKLNRYLPAAGGLKRKIARWLEIGA